MATAAPTATGRVIQITGAVVDIEFPAGKLPGIYNAVEVSRGDGVKIVCEVQQHLGNNWVRSVAMTTTDGLARGVEAVDTGGPITVPVGQVTLGPRLQRPRRADRREGPGRRPSERLPIHRPAPGVRPADDRDRDLRDRHQGHRPGLPVRQGRQDRRLRRRRRRQDRHHPGADPQRRRRSIPATPSSPAWASGPARATT